MGDGLASAFAAIDAAFAGSPRPEKSTDHPYCDECAEADAYFRNFTPVTIAYVTDPPETLPLSFLTDQRSAIFCLASSAGSRAPAANTASGTFSSTSKTASTGSTPSSAPLFATSSTSSTTA